MGAFVLVDFYFYRSRMQKEMCPCDFFVAQLHAGVALQLDNPFLSPTSSWVVAVLILVLVFLVFARAQQHLRAGRMTDNGCGLMLFVAFVSLYSSLIWSGSGFVFFFSFLTLLCAWVCEYIVWHSNIRVYLKREEHEWGIALE